MPFTYSQSALAYRDSQGRQVSQRVINQAVDAVIRGASTRMVALSMQLQEGTLTLAAWQEAMAAEMKPLHVGAAAMGRGGWQQMTPADWGWTGHELRNQYAYLRNFAHDIATGKQPLDGRLLNRARLYAEAARGTHREMQRRIAQQSGRTQELNQLGGSDRHCGTCVGCTAQGWVPIGTLPRVGGRTCGTNCHCTITTRHQPPLEAVA